jgi:hypothetical protein
MFKAASLHLRNDDAGQAARGATRLTSAIGALTP